MSVDFYRQTNQDELRDQQTNNKRRDLLIEETSARREEPNLRSSKAISSD